MSLRHFISKRTGGIILLVAGALGAMVTHGLTETNSPGWFAGVISGGIVIGIGLGLITSKAPPKAPTHKKRRRRTTQ